MHTHTVPFPSPSSLPLPPPSFPFAPVQAADAQAALTKIKDRHEDLKELEKSLLELHEMFTDMAILVEEQGWLVAGRR